MDDMYDIQGQRGANRSGRGARGECNHVKSVMILIHSSHEHVPTVA